MNIKRVLASQRLVWLLVCSVLAAAVGFVASMPDHADTGVERQTQYAGAIADPAVSVSDGDSAAAYIANGATVDIGANVSDGIKVSFMDSSLRIKLPDIVDGALNVNEAGRVQNVASSGVLNMAVPTADGVQLLTELPNRGSPRRFTYDVAGSRVETTADGGAIAYDDRGVIVMRAAPAWATDALGRSVPTHYESEGSKLVQVVDHTDGHFSYPIVADPWWSFLTTAAMTACGWQILDVLEENAAKQAFLRGDPTWTAFVNDSLEDCLIAFMFWGAGKVVSAAFKKAAIRALKPHMIFLLKEAIKRGM